MSDQLGNVHTTAQHGEYKEVLDELFSAWLVAQAVAERANYEDAAKCKHADKLYADYLLRLDRVIDIMAERQDIAKKRVVMTSANGREAYDAEWRAAQLTFVDVDVDHCAAWMS